MKKTILIIVSVLSLGIGSLGVSNPVFAEDAPVSSAKNQVISGINAAGGNENKTSAESLIKNIINVMLFLVGVLSVIMIIYGGIQYVISVGDSGKIGKAKTTIQYAIVGLVVSILAYAVVNFIVTKL